MVVLGRRAVSYERGTPVGSTVKVQGVGQHLRFRVAGVGFHFRFLVPGFRGPGLGCRVAILSKRGGLGASPYKRSRFRVPGSVLGDSLGLFESLQVFVFFLFPRIVSDFGFHFLWFRGLRFYVLGCRVSSSRVSGS